MREKDDSLGADAAAVDAARSAEAADPASHAERIDGGPAFPQHAETGNLEGWWHGMDLRDYFAAKAMQALIGRLGPIVKVEGTGAIRFDGGVAAVLPDNPAVNEEAGRQIRNAIAILAHEYADAMLAERAK